jgi:hypothetical protein
MINDSRIGINELLEKFRILVIQILNVIGTKVTVFHIRIHN